MPRFRVVKPMRLFLTVGSQMPFDRLTQAMADWARAHPGCEVLAQVGDSKLRAPQLQPLQWHATLAPERYRKACLEADLMVAHAGMGSILTALELQRPIVLMPRRGHLAETRNDHQVDTARHLVQRGMGCEPANGGSSVPPGMIALAWDEQDLGTVVDRMCEVLCTAPGEIPHVAHPAHQSADASPRTALIQTLRQVIASSRRP